MRASTRSLTVLLAISATASSALARQAQFIPLGDLPGGTFESRALSASFDGSVVVGYGRSSNREAFRWTASTGMVGLGDLPGGIFRSSGNCVSDDESVVVGRGNSASGVEAFRWTSAGGMVGLGDLPGGSFHSDASAASADGSVVVGEAVSAAGAEAFRWTAAGGMVGLGDLSGGQFGSYAVDVSPNGSVIVGWGHSTLSGPGLEAFRWTATGGMTALGDLPGGNFRSQAFAVSADGSVVIGHSDSASGLEAFRWTATGGMVGLGDLAGGAFDSQARGVSGDGTRVVGGSRTAVDTEAFLWSPSLGMVNLREHLISLGAAGLNGWLLGLASDISFDGNAIVGSGTNPSGEKEAWLAYLVSPSIGTSYCAPAVSNSTGLPAVIFALGSHLVANNDVNLTASQLPPNQFGYFLMSQTQGFVQNPGGSQGNLCLGSPIVRLLPPVLHSGAAGLFGSPIDLTNVPQVGAIQAGETWNFTAWFRDNNPGPTSNFTDGTSVTFL